MRIFVTMASVSSGSNAFTVNARGTSRTWPPRIGRHQVHGPDSHGNGFSYPITAVWNPFWVNLSRGDGQRGRLHRCRFRRRIRSDRPDGLRQRGEHHGRYRWISNAPGSTSISTTSTTRPGPPSIRVSTSPGSRSTSSARAPSSGRIAGSSRVGTVTYARSQALALN